jgi:hypothetical protein
MLDSVKKSLTDKFISNTALDIHTFIVVVKVDTSARYY